MPEPFAKQYEREYGTEDKCPKNKGKAHRPDWHNVTMERDGNAFYLDVVCRYCGRSGCIGTVKKLEESVDW